MVLRKQPAEGAQNIALTGFSKLVSISLHVLIFQGQGTDFLKKRARSKSLGIFLFKKNMKC